ncbi:MAG: tRNA (N(6)-L-threonylcarbamoyladenosine(37)-C(2))-methylthiotransferase MtaB [Bacteroidales bacterium]|nr:tRNA (N(6)-L-threonylcarbamoyladenosine(37)-C(2))-methylthiotransferase MtaB [Bacteroidales bacterium]
MQKTRIAFHTLGCKLNFSETSTISRQFGLQDFEVVDFGQEADVYVVHTCSVTATAEQKCKASIRQAHRRNPAAHVAVMGCAAQSNPDMFLKMEGVSWVLGNEDKFRLEEFVRSSLQTIENEDYHHIARQETGDISKTKKFIPSYSMNDRTRSFFKVQDGCDYFCTYCSIPFMRGRSRSESVENTMIVAREIAATSIKEIILTGVNIGDFGRQNGEKFIDLLRQLDQLDGIERIRISSIEPELLTDEIIHLVKDSKKLLPHFHIPLQSGNDRILDLMKRKYKREVFSNRVNTIKQLMPDACIAADVIVGFPGETEEDFQDAFSFIESLDITYMHLFTYSERPGTKALQMEGKVPEQEKRRRSKVMHELSEKKKLDFYKSQIGKEYNILWESDRSGEYMLGWTDNYVHCRTRFNPDRVNKIVACRLTAINTEKEAIFDVETVF